MLKRPIKYRDLNDEEQIEDFYFNLTKRELVEMEVREKAGFAVWLKRIIDAKDHKTLVEEFQKLILFCYGEKSEDGKRFIKNDQLREEFSQSCAYEVLFEELTTDEEAAAVFIIGTLPKEMATDAKKAFEATPTPPKV